MVAGFFYLIGRYFHGSAMITISLRRGLSRKAPSNARGDDPFLGGFFFNFFRPPRRGRSRNLALHRPSQAFSFLRGPTFLFCGNLLSLDRENDCALPFIFPSWFVPSGSRSDRAGPGIGEGEWGCMIHSYVIGRGNTATAYLQAGMIRPVPGATADAVVDVQGGSGRRVPQEAKLGRTATPAPECGQAKLRVKFIGREYN